MKYLLFKFNDSVLSPSEKAIEENQVPEYWDFYVKDLADTIDEEGLKNISKPISEIANKIRKEKQIDYLLELIKIVKEFDKEKKIDWINTNRIVAKCQLYFEFLKSEEAKRIDEKYCETYGIFKSTSGNNIMKHCKEQRKAFEVWAKSKLKV